MSPNILRGQMDFLSKRHLYDNGFNVSNYVPPQHVLRSKLHASLPILYLPEYIERRLNESGLAILREDSMLAEFFEVYRAYIDKFETTSQPPAFDQTDSDENIIIQILVRFIVIPTSLHVISKVKTFVNSKINVENPVEENSIISSSSSITKPMNPYLIRAKSTHFETKNKQSLESLVDGVISSLIRNHGKSIKSKVKSTSTKDKMNFMYRNLLCEGFKLMNDGYIKHPEKGQKSIPVAYSHTLGVGIQVTHPNACVSFAKSDPVMKKLHHLIGDDLLRELLLNSIILVPAGDFHNCPRDVTNGNYFQLCGKPLSSYSTNIQVDNLTSLFIKNAKDDDYDHPQSKRICIRESYGQSTSFDPRLLVDSHFIIPRHRILHSDSFVKSVGLPPRHILMKHTPEQPILLLKNVFPVERLNVSSNGMRRRWNLIYQGALEMFQNIIKNNLKINYNRRLEQACPIQSNSISCHDKEVALKDLVQRFSDKNSVGSFLVGVIKDLFPSECWGSSKNFEMIANKVRLFVCLRRQEEVSINTLTKGIKLSEIRWLNPKGGKQVLDHSLSTILIHHLLKWLFCDFIIPLIRSTFYVTGTEFTGDEVNYYRKPLWSKIRMLSLSLLNEEQFERVNADDVDEIIKNSLGYSQLRILPKASGIRPIALLCKVPHHVSTGTSAFKGHKSINCKLQDVFDILTQECKDQPDLFGVGVSGVSKLHGILLEFIEQLKCSTRKSLYFVSVDIHKCFDNMNQDFLLSLLGDTFRREEYIIQERTLLRPASDEAISLHEKKKHVTIPCSIKTSISSTHTILQNKKESILIEKSKCSLRSKSHLLDVISKHLKYNTVVVKEELGHTFLHQTKGIAQGSVLSTIFCNLYYGNIEKRLLNEVFSNKAVNNARFIARVVDDFLLITHDYYEAVSFQQHLEYGDKNLGVKINASKTKTSHKAHKGNILINDESLVTICDASFFPWCGYLFNIQTMEVHIDYRRFEGDFVKESLCIERVKTEGQTFRKRLCTFLAPRCQPILFDPKIHSYVSICINFYQALAFAAVKCTLYIQNGGLSDGINKNVNFVANSISELITYAYDKISLSLYHTRVNNSLLNKTEEGKHVKQSWLKKADASWLGYSAFINVFEAHSDFKILISIISEKQKYTHIASNQLIEMGFKARKMFDSSKFFNA